MVGLGWDRQTSLCLNVIDVKVSINWCKTSPGNSSIFQLFTFPLPIAIRSVTALTFLHPRTYTYCSACLPLPVRKLLIQANLIIYCQLRSTIPSACRPGRHPPLSSLTEYFLFFILLAQNRIFFESIEHRALRTHIPHIRNRNKPFTKIENTSNIESNTIVTGIQLDLSPQNWSRIRISETFASISIALSTEYLPFSIVAGHTHTHYAQSNRYEHNTPTPAGAI